MRQSALLQLAAETAPQWASEVILPFPEKAFQTTQQFAARHYWIAAGSINIFRVVGTQHPDYIGRTWREFLEQGKHMPANHALWEGNPGYYRETAPKKPGMAYVSLDGLDWFVGSADGPLLECGNHRTCIARFIFSTEGRTTLHGVTLSDWRVDANFLAAYRAIESLIHTQHYGWRVKHKSVLVRREDTAGWHLDHFDNRAVVWFENNPPPRGFAPKDPNEYTTKDLQHLADLASARPRRFRWHSR